MSSRSSAPLRPISAGAGQPSGERRSFPRYALDLPGRFMRADKLDYPCRLKEISVVAASMTTPAVLTIGEKLIVYLLHLGGLEGVVTRRFEGGFAMNITATQRKRDKLAGQILHLAENGPLPETEERLHVRSTGNETSTLLLSDGTSFDCAVLDMSHSGASVAVPARPPIGSEVVLSGQRASVVRHHDEGIGVEFLNEQENAAAFERYARKDEPQR